MSGTDGSPGIVESSRLWRYCIAILCVAVAQAVRLALGPVIASGHVLFIFTLAVMAAARIGGRGPGLLASSLSVLLTWYFSNQPAFSFGRANPIEMGSLVALALAGAGISLLSGRAPLSPQAGDERPGTNTGVGEQRQIEAALRSGDESLRTFVKYVPAAVAMLDREMRYLQVSDRWCADYSLSSDELLHRSHYEVFPDIPERWKEIHRRCLAGETLHVDEDCWERASGDTTWLRWEIQPWGGLSGKPEGLLIFSEDITARKGMEVTLRESEATIRALLQSAAQSILAVDVDGVVVLANRMAVEMFGHEHNKLLGMPLETLLPERFRTKHLSYRTEFAANPRPRPMGVGIDLQGLRKDGTEFPIEVSLSTVQASRGTLAVAFITDISKRKQAETSLRNSENELRALARSLLTAQEDERRRVARDLHDDVTQRLALLSIEIGKLAAGTSVSLDEITARLRSVQSQAHHASNEVRRLSHGLHPSVIEDFGLSTALEEFCEEFATAQGITLRFDGLAADEGLSADSASCLYRIAQECLRNVAKHARATEVHVGLTSDGVKVQLVVKDDGAGFSLGVDPANSGLGLISMKERIRMASGTLSINSQPGQGTAIVAAVPLSGGLA